MHSTALMQVEYTTHASRKCIQNTPLMYDKVACHIGHLYIRSFNTPER